MYLLMMRSWRCRISATFITGKYSLKSATLMPSNLPIGGHVVKRGRAQNPPGPAARAISPRKSPIQQDFQWTGAGSNRRHLDFQSRRNLGEWLDESVAGQRGGSDLLWELVGSDELHEALEEFAQAEGKQVEDLVSQHKCDLVWEHLHARKTREKLALINGGKPVYARFGALPKGGRSYNHRDGYYEKGVSVYRARLLNGRLYIIVSGTDAASALFICSSPVYLVDGQEIGVGSDREPLLMNCKARRFKGEYEIVA